MSRHHSSFEWGLLQSTVAIITMSVAQPRHNWKTLSRHSSTIGPNTSFHMLVDNLTPIFNHVHHTALTHRTPYIIVKQSHLTLQYFSFCPFLMPIVCSPDHAFCKTMLTVNVILECEPISLNSSQAHC